MSVVQLLKADRVSLYVDSVRLPFVVSFSERKQRTGFEIKQMLDKDLVDDIEGDTSYMLTITTLCEQLDSSTFCGDFTLLVDDGNSIYSYTHCRLKESICDINGGDKVQYKYIITAQTKTQAEVTDEQSDR